MDRIYSISGMHLSGLIRTFFFIVTLVPAQSFSFITCYAIAGFTAPIGCTCQLAQEYRIYSASGVHLLGKLKLKGI